MLLRNQTMMQFLLLASWISSAGLIAAEHERLSVKSETEIGDVIEMFSAVDAGVISVKFIPTDAAHANVVIQNNTDGVVHIELPDAFAAVPVLAQFGRDPLGGGKAGGGAAQGVGGGMNQGNGFGVGNGMQGGNGRAGGPGQGQGFGLGFMRIAPHKSRKVEATTVCLEFGKPEPNPRINYRMIPIEQFTTDAGVVELCKKLAASGTRQNTAQAVAWHLAGGLSWERLAEINRVESRYLGNIKFFTAKELSAAKELVESIKNESATKSPGDSPQT